MALSSRPPTFKAYGVKPVCAGCNRRLRATEPLWFEGGSADRYAFVLGRECFREYGRVLRGAGSLA